MIVARVRPCVDCERMTRPSKSRLIDYPDTIVRGSVDRCLTCYLKVRGRPEPKPRAPKPIRVTATSSVVLATVPNDRVPQRADCRPSCCRTPYGHSTVRDHLPVTDPAACRCHGGTS